MRLSNNLTAEQWRQLGATIHAFSDALAEQDLNKGNVHYDGEPEQTRAFEAAEALGWKWEDDAQFTDWCLKATNAEILREGLALLMKWLLTPTKEQVAEMSTDQLAGVLTLTVQEAREAIEIASDDLDSVEDPEELDKLSDVAEMATMTGTEAQKLLKHEIYLAAYMKSIGRA